ncbi:phospholipase A and acyltransferase 1 isoform X1 [Takifugu flavidus]|uniref:phospholipase A and acyltransferase 1 isoform X1 n=1 Tax=Takifugu flavidus TaxID=433684 RepID=UPI0025441389|nr:phospholipase A and acyltransferase 1 isoform X1 [Takifugu flavidus]
MGLKNSHHNLFPGDIIEYPRNKYFSHFAIYLGERDGVPYVAHLTCRDSDNKLPLFGRALRSEIKMDPLELLGKKYKVNNMLDDAYPVRDFHNVVKPAIDDMMGRDVTFDILFHNSEHQAALFRYGVKKSLQVSGRRRFVRPNVGEPTFVCVFQIEKVYKHIMPTWKKLFEEKKL